jgi:peptide deformylase
MVILLIYWYEGWSFMAIIPINVFGDSILRKKAKKLTNIDADTIKLIRNMFDSMHNANGIGLAANQVGADKALFVVDLSIVEDYEKHKPIVMINPEIKLTSKEKIIMEEGCLSIPYLKSEIERPERIEIAYYDTDFKEHKIEADDLFARVILHEYDHLKGVMFVDRISEEERKILKQELINIKNRNIDADYPISEKIKRK